MKRGKTLSRVRLILVNSFPSSTSFADMFFNLLITLSLLKGLSCLDANVYKSWYENHIKGTLLSALEVDCDWVLPDAGIVKKSYTVVCPSNCLNVIHCVRVKGSGPYTVNSPICLSAIHSGVIEAQKGGAVEVEVVEGQKNYGASVKNGIATIPYGPYFASILLKKSDIDCGSTAPPTPAPCVDAGLLDLVFVADSSRSVNKDNFKLEKNFIADLVSAFPIAATKSRVGLITFNTNAKTRFRLETYGSNIAVKHAIDAVPYEAGGTFLSKALHKVRTDMKYRSDPKVHKFVVVFTDGRLFQEDNVVPPIKALASEGVNVIVLGVGHKAEDVLLQIANGKKENVFEAESYAKLREKLTGLIQKICTFVFAG